MGFIRALIFIFAGCLISGGAWTEDLCPAGPFETDVGVISAAIASHPLRPRVWDASGTHGTPYGGISDGAAWYLQLSCATREALVLRIYALADDWVTEPIARAGGR